MPKPCRSCGGPKPGGRGVVLCDTCRERRLPTSLRAELRRASTQDAYQQWKSTSRKRRTAPTAPPGQGWCGMCQSFLPLADFGRRKGAKKATYCKTCESNHRFSQNLADKYGGMTTEQYDMLLKRQQGCCAICGTAPRTRRLAVDHDHKTGKVRGLLCKRCNHNLLGAAHDQIPLLRKAIAYLQHPPAHSVFRSVPVGEIKKGRR